MRRRDVLMLPAFLWMTKSAWADAQPADCASGRYGEWETVGYLQPKPKQKYVLSLRRLQKALMDKRITADASLPVTRVRGAALEPDGEILLMGLAKEDSPAAIPLLADDIAVAMRSILMFDAAQE